MTKSEATALKSIINAVQQGGLPVVYTIHSAGFPDEVWGDIHGSENGPSFSFHQLCMDLGRVVQRLSEEQYHRTQEEIGSRILPPNLKDYRG